MNRQMDILDRHLPAVFLISTVVATATGLGILFLGLPAWLLFAIPFFGGPIVVLMSELYESRARTARRKT